MIETILMTFRTLELLDEEQNQNPEGGGGTAARKATGTTALIFLN